MTAPDRSAAGGTPSAGGATRSTYFSPNRVFGTRRAMTLAGMRGTIAGSSARCNDAPAPSAVISRTSPTTTPRTFTSAPRPSCIPVWSVRTVTQVTGVNALLYASTDSTSRPARKARNARPRKRLVKASPRDPYGRGGAPDGQHQEEVHADHAPSRAPY